MEKVFSIGSPPQAMDGRTGMVQLPVRTQSWNRTFRAAYAGSGGIDDHWRPE